MSSDEDKSLSEVISMGQKLATDRLQKEDNEKRRLRDRKEKERHYIEIWKSVGEPTLKACIADINEELKETSIPQIVISERTEGAPENVLEMHMHSKLPLLNMASHISINFDTIVIKHFTDNDREYRKTFKIKYEKVDGFDVSSAKRILVSVIGAWNELQSRQP